VRTVRLSHRPLAVATVLFAVWTGVGIVADRNIAAALYHGRELNRLELATVVVHGQIARFLPYAAAPFLLAPAAVVGWWLLASARARQRAQAKADCKILNIWIAWLILIVVSAIVVLVAWPFTASRSRVVPVLLWVLVCGSWAYAGAIWAALAVHAHRLAAGRTRISVEAVAAAAAAGAVLQPFGVLVPVWVAWCASREKASE
jgi:hypothetical protein